MAKKLLLFLFILNITNCKAQNEMEQNEITLTINTDHLVAPSGSAVQIYYQEGFDTIFSMTENNVITLKDKNQLYNGEIVLEYPSEKLFSNYSYKNGLRDGNQTGFYESGKKMFETPYEKGKINGIQKSFYENGILASHSVHVEGMLQDNYFNNYENGNIERKVGENNYVTRYFKNGEIMEDGRYDEKFSNRNGQWIYYYENGNKKEEGKWDMGGRHGNDNIKLGIWKYYNEEGELINTQEYNNMGMEIKKN